MLPPGKKMEIPVFIVRGRESEMEIPDNGRNQVTHHSNRRDIE